MENEKYAQNYEIARHPESLESLSDRQGTHARAFKHSTATARHAHQTKSYTNPCVGAQAPNAPWMARPRGWGCKQWDHGVARAARGRARVGEVRGIFDRGRREEAFIGTEKLQIQRSADWDKQSLVCSRVSTAHRNRAQG